METEIRAANISDAENVHTYYCALLEEKIPYIRDNPRPTLEKEVEFIKAFVEGMGELFLLMHNAKVIGMLGIRRSAHYQESHRINIGISIHKEFRGKGLGTKLLNKAKHWSKETGVSSIELEAVATNPAINLYKKLGYNEVGRIKDGFKVNNQFHDIFYMQLCL